MRVEHTNLNTGAVDELLQVFQPHHVVVHVPPHLQQPVAAVRRHAVRADAGAAVEAADVLLVLLGVLVEAAADEELLGVKRFQPRRLPYRLSTEKRNE